MELNQMKMDSKKNGRKKALAEILEPIIFL
jgi:hypothetical protein